MGLNKLILTLLLSFLNIFRFLMPIKKNKITFISITSNVLDQDFKEIDHLLKKVGTYDLHYNLIVFKKTLKDDFLYMLNCMKQLYQINTSKMIILNDNNFVVTKFKRKGTYVLQTWHACGAIKKFGNQIERQYPIKNYDMVVVNSNYWIEAYCEAFGVNKQQILLCGMPRVDKLCKEDARANLKENFFQKYPSLRDMYIVLYAPTFRGNIIKGLRYEKLDVDNLLSQLPDNYALLYKMHPLLKEVSLGTHERLYNVSEDDLHMLLCACDCLISDYSSILFDYAILQKKAICYACDYEEYDKTIGFNVDYLHDMPSDLCTHEEMLIQHLTDKQFDQARMKKFQETFMPFTDGQNGIRVVEEIKKRMP